MTPRGRLSRIGLAILAALLPFASLAQRGSDGHVNVIYWQAPSILNPYLSGGIKDIESSSLVIEPLARYDPDGNLAPWLAAEIPTVENGGISPDLTSITWNLRRDIRWSDGSRFTAQDPVFTARYCMHPDGGCAQLSSFDGVDAVEALGPHTVRITFKEPTPFPYGPFVGAESPILQKAQFQDCLGTRASSCTEQNFRPHGTGPFVVESFRPNDVIQMRANPNYRDPSKPAFATLTLKGGGNAAAAARAVLETGEFDYAWNLQLPPDALSAMEGSGKGKVISGFGPMVERLMVNLTDPDPALGGERSTRKHPHPFLSDHNVRRALSLSIDRALLVDIGYGAAGKVTCNVLPAPAAFNSTANDSCAIQDVNEANRILEEAGWRRGEDGIRSKDGMRLSLLFQTSTNPVRQDFQALLKQWWHEIGIETELRSVSSSVFFGGGLSSPDTVQKFFADIQMYFNTFNGTDPQAYLGNWKCGREPRPETQWQGSNIPRFCDPRYDALHNTLQQTASIGERARIAKELNDILMQKHVIIPLVHRGRVSARADSLAEVRLNVWDSELWNAADWRRR